jgi:hypothetical protein
MANAFATLTAMTLSPGTEAETAEKPTPSGRRIIFVAGSGRSGTSVITGILERAGYHVPQPTVTADSTNPTGFGEPLWVVELHTRLLRQAQVWPSDARPAAWLTCGQIGQRPAVLSEVVGWLETNFEAAARVVVKDPRLGWFLPMWEQAAIEVGAVPAVITMLRHPAEVVSSKRSAYGEKPSPTSRTAAWINQMLYIERATRDMSRALVSYDQILNDWTTIVPALGTRLDQPAIRELSARQMAAIHELVDPGLRTKLASWDGLGVTAAVRDLAEESYAALLDLSNKPADISTLARLDDCRRAYTQLYNESEAIAYSSVWARTGARASAQQPGSRQRAATEGSAWRASRIPHRIRALVPGALRRTVKRVLAKPHG